MNQIIPADRSQITYGSLEEVISVDDPARFLDAFVEKLELFSSGFQMKNNSSDLLTTKE